MRVGEGVSTNISERHDASPNTPCWATFICGPVHCRWMYPIERYMKTLKDYVRTLAYPEGSIAEGYRMEDTLGFCTEYMKQYKVTTHRVWDPTEEPAMNDKILTRNEHTKRKMSDEMCGYAHAFVIDNAPCLEPWQEWVPISSLQNVMIIVLMWPAMLVESCCGTHSTARSQCRCFDEHFA